MKFLFTILTIFCSTLCIAQYVVNPVFDRTDIPSFRVEKIEITSDTTYVHCLYYAEEKSWANISKRTFLRDIKTHKTFPIYRSSGLPFDPQQRIFACAERCELLLCFPSIAGVEQIDFIEKENEKAFNVYGIDLKNEFETIYTEIEPMRFSNIASFYDSVGDTIKAIQYKEKEMAATKCVYGIKSEPLLVTMAELCVVYNKYGYYQLAINQMAKLAELHAEIWGKTDWSYALQLRTFAQFYSYAKKHEEAIKKYQESISLFELLNIVDNEYALALRFIADEYYEIGDYENALTYQQKAINARRLIGDSDAYIDELHCILFGVHGGNEDIQKRILIVETELANLPVFIENTSIGIANIQKEIAARLSLLDRNVDAIRYCDKAIIILITNGKDTSEEYADLLRFKCKYQQRSGLKDEAIASGETAKQLYESLNIKSLGYAELLGDLALAYGETLQFEKSIQLEEIASKIYENAKDWLSLVGKYNTISEYYQRAENLDLAERYIRKAIDLQCTHDDAKEYIQTEIELTGNGLLNNRHHLASVQLLIDANKSNFYQTLGRIWAYWSKWVVKSL